MKTSADADVRRSLDEYYEARNRVQDIERKLADADQPSEIRDRFERLAEAAAGAERMAQDALSNAVASCARSSPCAVVVDEVGGSSVVVLSGKPDGMIVVTGAYRISIKDVLCRPEPPPEFARSYRRMAPNLDGVYHVRQRGDLVAIYNSVYFRSTNEVVADFQDLIQAGFEGVWGEDYVIWCSSRIMAVIHQPMDEDEKKLVLFNDSRNDPIAGRAVDPLPYWPTYEEWIESGRGGLWKTDRYP